MSDPISLPKTALLFDEVQVLRQSLLERPVEFAYFVGDHGIGRHESLAPLHQFLSFYPENMDLLRNIFVDIVLLVKEDEKALLGMERGFSDLSALTSDPAMSALLKEDAARCHWRSQLPSILERLQRPTQRAQALQDALALVPQGQALGETELAEDILALPQQVEWQNRQDKKLKNRALGLTGVIITFTLFIAFVLPSITRQPPILLPQQPPEGIAQLLPQHTRWCRLELATLQYLSQYANTDQAHTVAAYKVAAQSYEKLCKPPATPQDIQAADVWIRSTQNIAENAKARLQAWGGSTRR